jgi:DNA recombination-dependent growth factor C
LKLCFFAPKNNKSSINQDTKQNELPENEEKLLPLTVVKKGLEAERKKMTKQQFFLGP